MANKKQPEKNKKTTTKKKNVVKITSSGKAMITSTYNNTVISLTNSNGDVICWSTPGLVGFTGARASTPYAATIAAEDAGKKALEKGLQSVEVVTKGPGVAKISAVKGIKSSGLKISSIKDVTPLPHNGCRSRKQRRM